MINNLSVINIKNHVNLEKINIILINHLFKKNIKNSIITQIDFIIVQLNCHRTIFLKM